MEGSSTDSLRTLAPSWTLAGDDMLLTLLQNTHQRILSKCQEVNTKLYEMTSSLDDASIDLQNVNNKFMSLSNRKFIESRVYDDDADLTTQAQTNMEQPKHEQQDEVNIIKNSISILESKYETTEIIDESDSDSDLEISVVLKPKDVYWDRPLPYIIGSQMWKNKWHAGLIIEASDTDSIPSKEQSDVEYSDSEVEDIQTDRHNDNTVSESSSLHSDQDRVQDRVPDRILPQPTAAEIAANIASVMARTQPLIERPVTPPSPKQYIPRKPPAVYKPTQPLTSRVFPDEPPPLDDSQQYSSSSSQEDIFAEINKNKPHSQGFKVQSGLTEDLFGKKEKEDIFGGPYDEGSSYFKDEPPPIKRTPIKEETESKLVEQSQNAQKNLAEENTVKKPVGGISVFGSNKHTDTIGAAILKRNIRKSSTSDESGRDVPVTNKTQTNMAAESRNVDEIDNRKQERDIFDDLFAKSNAANNKNINNNKKEQKTIVNSEKKQNKDLFSDNIFDDIDDIFSSDIKIPSKTDKPSLFDDVDDLFADIAKTDENISKDKDAKSPNVKSNLFDSDDELFSDIKISKIDQEDKISSKTVHPTITSKNDDNTEGKQSNTAQTSAQAELTISKTSQPVTTNKVVEAIQKSKVVSIFDTDSDEDIFNFNKSAPKSNIENNSAKFTLKTEETKKFQSPLLFGDDEINELYVNVENNKVDSKIQSNKFPAKEEVTKEKQEQNENSNLNEIESKMETSVATDPLLSESNNGKSALNLEQESSKLFENNTLSKEINKQDSNTSNNKETTLEPEAQSSKSIESSPTFTPGLNKLDETKAPENANVEVISSDKSNFKTTNDQTKLLDSDNKTKAKETLLSKPNVPIFNEHLFDDIEPPPFNPAKESTENIIENISKEMPEIPIFEDKFENMYEEKPNIPTFEDQIKNTAKEIPPVVPIFDDIITEPPIFEKAKEPKKSKNVNALFDDDSEDEALFFKKNDVISDEKPNVFSNAVNFGLFTDEPPPDDLGNDLFGSKHDPDPILKDQVIESDDILKNQNIESDKIDQKSDVATKLNEKFYDVRSKSEGSKTKVLPSQSLFDNDSDEDIFSFNKASTSKKTLDSLIQNENNSENKESKQISTQTDTVDTQKGLFDDLDDNLFTTKTQQTEITTSNSNNIIKKDIECKKVGKLTTNLNINVQALVPGTSPKKIKSEKVDTEPKTVKHIDIEPQIAKPTDTDPKMVKSISFEDKPDTGVLDNNASKQRAKIQVKRRPSSRRARHEAVRKSALDLDQSFEPSDQKSSTENSPKHNVKESPENLSISHEKSDIIDQYFEKTEHKNIDTNAISHDSNTAQSNSNENISKTQITQNPNQNNNKNTDNKKEKSTKVVYVLNDEDIFTNPIKHDTVSARTLESNEAKAQETATKNVEKITKVEENSSKVEQNTNTVKGNTTKLEANTTKIKENTSKLEENTTKIKENISKVEENTTKVEENPIKPIKKVSLFDSDEDEADSLFKTKPIVKKTKNTKLFDSDSEDDLFSKKTPNVKENEKTLKKSLFDDDDEDLFGAKPKTKLENKPISSTSKEKVEEKKDKTKTIFADPLSLFGYDDDDSISAPF